jgi:predicted dienelactone hydrolase
MDFIAKAASILVAALAATCMQAALAATPAGNAVGFDVAQANTSDGPIALATWYPTSSAPRPTPIPGGLVLEVAPKGVVSGDGLPLVLVSHGNGGSALGHVDLAMALARAGFVVVAPTHPGDNYADASAQGAADLYSRRNRQLRSTLDYMLGQWPSAAAIDPDRIGAFGMSAGAFTVLTLAGGQPRMQAISGHCAKTPEFICRALSELKSPLLDGADGSGAFAADGRIKALAIAAPGLGFAFAHGGLKDVHVPVQLWIGDRDDTVPAASNASIIQRELGDRVETHVVPGAAHVSFLAPCGELKLPAICTDPEGFDRVAAHVAMDAQVVGFFQARLPEPATR